MMIIDPVTLGDVSCTRASTATYFDRNGVMQTAPANTLRVTYDPSDLSKAPYALVEAAATNLLANSEQADLWAPAQTWVSPNAIAAPGGGLTADWLHEDAQNNFHMTQADISGVVAGQAYTYSVFVKPAGRSAVYLRAATGFFANGTYGLDIGAAFDLSGDGAVAHYDPAVTPKITKCADGWFRISCTVTGSVTGAGVIYLFLATDTATSHNANPTYQGDNSSGVYVWGRQFEVGPRASSYIPTAGAPVTRAADVIAPGAGLVFSNVAITETLYNSGSTYALNSVVYDPVTYLTYQSLIANNTGRALADTTAWTPLKLVVNQRLMLDQYNNTQTSNAEEIIIVLSPRAIAQGIFLGNVDAIEARISSVDLSVGLVYQEVQSLLVSTSGGSFYNWCFKRWKKRSYAASVQLPPYANSLVTIAIKKPGGVAKCGMCVLGPLVDVGLAQYGLSREIKDYSTVNFNFDGTSNVVLRNFAKIMDVDLVIDNDQIDSVIEALEGYRQKPVAWIGTAIYGSACLFGTYTSFKNVIAYPTQSNMSLQIQGTV